jgi:hypothetical protein
MLAQNQATAAEKRESASNNLLQIDRVQWKMQTLYVGKLMARNCNDHFGGV